jgi:penicillin-binding protein 1B
VFANGGAWVQPRSVVSYRDAHDAAVASPKALTHPALDPRVNWLMVSMLEEVMRSGTAAGVRARGFNLPAAGKTGTAHDGWFAGFTSQLLCIVWVGFDDYRELNIEGAKSALPIWTDFMKRASRQSPYRNAKEFPMPRGIESAQICPASGMLSGDKCPDSRSEFFIAGSEPSYCDMHHGQIAPEGTPASDPAVTTVANR